MPGCDYNNNHVFTYSYEQHFQSTWYISYKANAEKQSRLRHTLVFDGYSLARERATLTYNLQ